MVLTYHAVRPEQRGTFEKHMDALLKAGSPVFADTSAHVDNGGRYVAVTFDDGFQSVLRNALPAMGQRNIPATIFVPTGYLGESPGWIYHSGQENSGEVLVTEEQLRHLPDDLVAVGSHGVTHPYLAQIGEEKAFLELWESRRRLKEILQRDVSLFSLPFGSFDNRVLDLARQAGYRRVFSNVPAYQIPGEGQYLVGRIAMSLDDWPVEYRLKMLGAYQWLPFGIRIKRRLRSLYTFRKKRFAY